MLVIHTFCSFIYTGNTAHSVDDSIHVVGIEGGVGQSETKSEKL